jgi:hypothetical protein
MPYGARALGQESLRLRSRRLRSDRAQRLSVRLLVLVFVFASLIGFVGASLLDGGIDLRRLVVPG